MGESQAVENRVVSVELCVPHPQNYNQHGEEQIGDLRLSLRKFGQVRSVVVQDDGAGGFLMVAGHGILEAAKLEGFETLRADVIPQEWPPVKVLSYLAADNELGKAADPDQEQLAALVQSVGDVDEDLAALAAGGDDALDSLMAYLSIEDEEVPRAAADTLGQMRDEWGTASGQLWEIRGAEGRVHRLLCGDSTDAGDVERLLAGARPLLMVADPPYGVELDGTWRYEAGANENPTPRHGGLANDDRADWGDVFTLYGSDVVYAWHASSCAAQVRAGLERARYKIRQQIVWIKDRFAIGRGAYHWAHEPCFLCTREGVPLRVPSGQRGRMRLAWAGRRSRRGYDEGHDLAAYAVRMGKTASWRGGRKQTTVWRAHSPIQSAGTNEAKQFQTLHPTQKPIELYERPYRNHTRRGDAVVDPFAGSGMCFIAAERTGRVGYGMELDPRFVAVALQLATDFGMEVSLAGDGDISQEMSAVMA
ncbi:MAG: hypothetical protein GVY30_12205 [Chloroflexi bacterium]|nr:hypothetical protein [Chloroflexota bacterium]